MKRFKLPARPLATWCCIADGIFILAFVVIALMSCPPLTMHGERTENGFIQVISFFQLKVFDCNYWFTFNYEIYTEFWFIWWATSFCYVMVSQLFRAGVSNTRPARCVCAARDIIKITQIFAETTIFCSIKALLASNCGPRRHFSC